MKTRFEKFLICFGLISLAVFISTFFLFMGDIDRFIYLVPRDWLSEYIIVINRLPDNWINDCLFFSGVAVILLSTYTLLFLFKKISGNDTFINGIFWAWIMFAQGITIFMSLIAKIFLMLIIVIPIGLSLLYPHYKKKRAMKGQ